MPRNVPPSKQGSSSGESSSEAATVVVSSPSQKRRCRSVSSGHKRRRKETEKAKDQEKRNAEEGPDKSEREKRSRDRDWRSASAPPKKENGKVKLCERNRDQSQRKSFSQSNTKDGNSTIDNRREELTKEKDRRRSREREREKGRDRDEARAKGKSRDRHRERERDRDYDRDRDRGKKDNEKVKASGKEEYTKDRVKDKDGVKQRAGDKNSKVEAGQAGRSAEKADELSAVSGKVDKSNVPNGAEMAVGPNAGLVGLGDLAALQKRLNEDRESLQLFVIKAKQEYGNKQETKDRKERRNKEYYRAETGEPCGPDNRLILDEMLGYGAFSTVYRCTDLKANCKEYAVKFIRSNVMLRKASEKEVRLMRKLRSLGSEKDPDGARFLLGLAGPEVFEHQGHLAMVFQLQKCSLRAGLARYGQGGGLPISLVKTYGRNIFMALRALSRINVIHGDLKPDNLLISLDKASVKLSDFGSAMEESERVRTDFLQAMYYRAPEVILGHAYNSQIDIWSAGCTLFELATGKFLFVGRNNNGMLHEMLKGCGPFTKKFATSGDYSTRHFTSVGHFRMKPDTAEKEEVKPMALFPKHSPAVTPYLKRLREESKEPIDLVEARVHQQGIGKLAELILKCMTPDPSERMSPEPALAHRFLKEQSGSGTK